jgi:hypothetical protein
MALTRTSTLRIIRYTGIVMIAALIIAYAIWRSLNYARGPQIEVIEPANGASVSASTVVIHGQALRVNSLFLNGNSVSVDQQGNFNETVIVFPGLNVLTLSANDQFGRSTEKELEIVGTNGLPNGSPNTSSNNGAGSATKSTSDNSLLSTTSTSTMIR